MTTTAPGVLEETPDRDGAFPRLSAEQIARLAEQGERRRVGAGDVLYREGEVDYDFYVILSGRVASIEGYGAENEVIAVHGPGRFLGELSLLTREAALVAAVVQEPGEVLAVPAERLRMLVSMDSALGDLILRACLLRRSFLIGAGAGFRIVGSRFSPDTRRLREFAARNRLPHRWLDLEEDRTAEALVRQMHVRPDETPIVIVGSGHVLRNPSNAELAEVIGLRPANPPEAVCDLLVVGAGPSGLAASVYAASEGLTTTALDAVATGGQAATSSRIENYLGFPAGISGGELAERATIQARKFGARVTVPAEARALHRADGHYVVPLDDGTEIAASTVVIATGARYRKLPVARLEELEGTSVYYAATLVEAQMCAGDPVAVVGGGNSAGQATLFLSQRAAKVRLLLRSGDPGRDMSRYLADRIGRNPKVEVMLNTEVREATGDRTLEALVVEDNRTGERRTIAARALFVFIGADPHTDWLGDAVALDRRGFVLTGRDVPARATSDSHSPLLLETSLPGVMAVGDVRSGSVKRVASAVGEGAMAVRLVHEHLNGHANLER